MFSSGRFYIDNGFRVGVCQQGYKWSHVIYLGSSKLRCKRIKNIKLGKPKPLEDYSTVALAKRLLDRKTISGIDRYISKRASTILNTIIKEC